MPSHTQTTPSSDKPSAPAAGDKDKDRDSVYAKAARVTQDLDTLEIKMRSVIESVNSAQLSTTENDTLSVIMKILNNHYSTLMWIENQTNDLTARLDKAK